MTTTTVARPAQHRAPSEGDVFIIDTFSAGTRRVRVLRRNPDTRPGAPVTYQGDVLVPGTFNSEHNGRAITFAASQILELLHRS